MMNSSYLSSRKIALIISLVFLIFYVFSITTRRVMYAQFDGNYLLIGALSLVVLVVFYDKFFKSFQNLTKLEYSKSYIVGFKILLVLMVAFRSIVSLRFQPFTSPISFLILSDAVQGILIQPVFAQTIKILLFISIPFFVLEKVPKISSVTLALTFIILQTMNYSYGKMGHSTHLLALILIGYVLYYFFFNYKDKTKWNIPIILSFIFISLYYFLSFLAKIYISQTEWINSYSLRIWINFKMWDSLGFNSNFTPNILQTIILSSPAAALLLSLYTLVIEFLGGISVFITKYRPVIYAGLVLLHVGIYFSMGIVFLGNILILAYLITDWPVQTKKLYLLTKTHIFKLRRDKRQELIG